MIIGAAKPRSVSSGMPGLAAIAFFGGNFGSNLVGGLRNMASKG
jgi:hypothetical protein